MLGSSLATRITLLLLGGFAVVQLIVVTALALPASEQARRSYELPPPDELAAIVHALESLPAAERPRLIPALNGSFYTVQLMDRAPPPRGTNAAPDLRQLKRDFGAALPDRVVDIRGRDGPLSQLVRHRRGPLRFLSPVRISVAPVAGRTLVLDSRPSDVARADMRRRARQGAVGVLLVLAALLIAIRQTTRPIARLRDGVRQFGVALSAPDLVPSGSTEMRELAEAFNDMKGRIAASVTDRTRMLAAIAHDMRTYLTRLRLRADYIADAEQRTRAISDLDEMALLLDDTLMFARPRQRRSVARRIAVPQELAAVAAIRREAGQEIDLDVSGIDPAAAIVADPLSLRRMIANLIDNGLRYGTRVALCAVEAEGVVEIIVRDDGPGIPSDLLKRLGEPYLRGEPSRNRTSGGAGLGLAIVHALAVENEAELRLVNLPSGFQATLRFRNQARLASPAPPATT